MKNLFVITFLLLTGIAQAGELPKSAFQLSCKQDFHLVQLKTEKSQLDIYREALAEAKSRNCPLVVWCNRECVPCRAATTDCVHVSVTNIDGDDLPCVYVAVNHNGTYCNCGAITGPINSNILRAKIDETKRAVFAAMQPKAQPVQYEAAPQQYYSMPMQSFGGRSFGGGSCRGGG